MARDYGPIGRQASPMSTLSPTVRTTGTRETHRAVVERGRLLELLDDGLVAQRSGMEHSMNYRCAVIIGRARAVDDPAERARSLDLIVDHMIPGRAATLRAPTRKELAATAVLALPLREASMKERAGGPADEDEDIAAGTWGGHIPLRRVALAPVSSPDSHTDVPADVIARAAALGDLDAAGLG